MLTAPPVPVANSGPAPVTGPVSAMLLPERLIVLPASIAPPAIPSAPGAVPEALSVTKPPAPIFANWIDSPSTET